MRILISIVVCAFLGALAFELPGVGLGVLVGLVVGLIWHGRAREAKNAAAQMDPVAVAAPPSIIARLDAIEARLATLESGATGAAGANRGMHPPVLAFTIAVAGLWGEQYYTPDLLASTEPFLILFFAMYVGIAVLFATRQAPNLKITSTAPSSLERCWRYSDCRPESFITSLRDGIQRAGDGLRLSRPGIDPLRAASHQR